MTLNNSAAKPTVLCIGGLDPSGCAGISADAQTIHALGGHAYSIASCLTVQSANSASQSKAVSPGLLAAQLRALCTPAGTQPNSSPQAVKIGVIQDARQWRLLKRLLPQNAALVIDPVLSSSSGLQLASFNRQWQRGFSQLASRAQLLTPNQQEYEFLQPLIALSTPVLVTGECHDNTITNHLWRDGKIVAQFKSPEQSGEYRGSGCRLSSAIAYYLATGTRLEEAITKAMVLLQQSIQAHYLIGDSAVPDMNAKQTAATH